MDLVLMDLHKSLVFPGALIQLQVLTLPIKSTKKGDIKQHIIATQNIAEYSTGITQLQQYFFG